LIVSISNLGNQSRTSKIIAKISENSNIDVRHKHNIITKRSVTINLQTNCDVCEIEGTQNIGDSGFAVFPDLSICHFRCLNNMILNNNSFDKNKKDKNIHPKSGNNFLRYPMIIDYNFNKSNNRQLNN
jgi:hypothetical protein